MLDARTNAMRLQLSVHAGWKLSVQAAGSDPAAHIVVNVLRSVPEHVRDEVGPGCGLVTEPTMHVPITPTSGPMRES